MDIAEQTASLRADGDALAAAAALGPGAAVAACPGWDVVDLVRHVGGVHSRFRAQIERGPDERVSARDVAAADPPPGEPEALIAWYRAGAARLADAIDGMDRAAEWPTWAGPRPARWVARRMAQETAVHRWDVQQAVGEPAGIDRDLAVDGIDEFLEVFVPLVPPERLTRTGTLHLHATDPGLEGDAGEWLVELSGDGIGSSRGHAKGDVAVRAAAGDLLLLVWNRVPGGDSRYEVFGDASLLAHWRDTVAI
jgi:uncharacterized protein (TIGR03083 family)